MRRSIYWKTSHWL